MAGDSSLTLEQVNLGVEKIGSMLRSMSSQIAGIRARVADLEKYGLKAPHNGNGSGLLAAAKKRPKTGKRVGAKRGKRKPEPAKRRPEPAKRKPQPAKRRPEPAKRKPQPAKRRP